MQIEVLLRGGILLTPFETTLTRDEFRSLYDNATEEKDVTLEDRIFRKSAIEYFRFIEPKPTPTPTVEMLDKEGNVI